MADGTTTDAAAWVNSIKGVRPSDQFIALDRRLFEDCIARALASLPHATTTVPVALPPEIAAHILKIGRVEWGQTHAHDAEGHGEHVARSVRLTGEAFAQQGDQHMHGLWLEGMETVVAHTGTSPNAPATTQALVGMWNWFHDQAVLTAGPAIPATGEAGA